MEFLWVLLSGAVLIVILSDLSHCQLFDSAKLVGDRDSFASGNCTELVEPFLNFPRLVIVNFGEKLRLVIRRVQALAIVVAKSCRFNCNQVTNFEPMLLIAQIFTPATYTNWTIGIIYDLKEFSELWISRFELNRFFLLHVGHNADDVDDLLLVALLQWCNFRKIERMHSNCAIVSVQLDDRSHFESDAEVVADWGEFFVGHPNSTIGEEVDPIFLNHGKEMLRSVIEKRRLDVRVVWVNEFDFEKLASIPSIPQLRLLNNTCLDHPVTSECRQSLDRREVFSTDMWRRHRTLVSHHLIFAKWVHAIVTILNSLHLLLLRCSNSHMSVTSTCSIIPMLTDWLCRPISFIFVEIW